MTVARNELPVNTGKLAGSKKQGYWTLVQYAGSEQSRGNEDLARITRIH